MQLGDVELVREVVRALADADRAAGTRELLRGRLGARPPISLKALLAAAPLEGIQLARDPGVGRDIDI